MRISEEFGIRLNETEVRQLIVEHLANLGFVIRSEDINIVPLTSNKSEFIIRQFEKK